MADMVLQRDVLDLTLQAPASAFASITAGGAGDNAAITGTTIDRYNYGVALCAVFDIRFQATMANANTLTLKSLQIEHSPDGATWTVLTTFTDPGVVLTGAGNTQQGVARVGTSLREAYRYIRFDFTPDLSAANTDTAILTAGVTFAGFDRLPPIIGSAA